MKKNVFINAQFGEMIKWKLEMKPCLWRTLVKNYCNSRNISQWVQQPAAFPWANLKIIILCPNHGIKIFTQQLMSLNQYFFLWIEFIQHDVFLLSFVYNRCPHNKNASFLSWKTKLQPSRGTLWEFFSVQLLAKFSPLSIFICGGVSGFPITPNLDLFCFLFREAIDSFSIISGIFI